MIITHFIISWTSDNCESRFNINNNEDDDDGDKIENREKEHVFSDENWPAYAVVLYAHIWNNIFMEIWSFNMFFSLISVQYLSVFILTKSTEQNLNICFA